MPLMLLFQVHKKFLPVFLVWFISVRSYILFYISWDLCGYKNIQMLCRSACFKRRIYVCPVVCFFVLFTCSHPLLLTCQTVEGRHTVSHLLYCGSFWALGGRFFSCSEPASLTCSQSGLPCGEGDNEIFDRVTDYHEISTYSTIPLLRLFLVPRCAVSSWGLS